MKKYILGTVFFLLSSQHVLADSGKIRKFECYYSEKSDLPSVILDGEEYPDVKDIYYRVLLTHEYREPTYYGLQLRISFENESKIQLLADHISSEEIFFNYDKTTGGAFVSVGIGEIHLEKCVITHFSRN